jgi:hypothetical protein
MNLRQIFSGALLLMLSIARSSVADPNIIEVPNSIFPATVEQWSRYSFSIDIQNTGQQDIQLDPNTLFRFGLGTGHAYTGAGWGATDENKCWVNLVEEVLIPSGEQRP